MTEFKKSYRYKSFKHASRGLLTMLISQHSAWIHTLATVLVCLLGLYVGLTRFEWCWIVISVISVWTAEALNTAFEFFLDVASPEFHPLVEKAKDVAAGAVLITAIGAVIIGWLIFGPYIFKIAKTSLFLNLVLVPFVHTV